MKLRRVIAALLAAICILNCFPNCTLGAFAEGTNAIYATTSASLKQGDTGYAYIYIDDLTNLASVTVTVHFDPEKITAIECFNQIALSNGEMHDISIKEDYVQFSYILNGGRSEGKTNLFYFKYQVNSNAPVGSTYFDITVSDAYDSNLDEVALTGSRCAIKITQKPAIKYCNVYQSGVVSTTVQQEFTISYHLSTSKIASGAFTIQYDPELFECVSWNNGDMLENMITDANTSLAGSVYVSFVGTEYGANAKLGSVTFRVRKNVTQTSLIQFKVSGFYDADLNALSGNGCTTSVNVQYDETYTEGAPNMTADATYDPVKDQVQVNILLDANTHLGAGDFVLKFDTTALQFSSAQKGFAPTYFLLNDKKVSEGILKFSVISLQDIVQEQLVLTVVFDALRECRQKNLVLELSGSGLTNAMTQTIVLNFVDGMVTLPEKHTFTSDCDTTCEFCDYRREGTAHTLVHHEAKKETCTEIGWNAYDTCSLCDYSTYVKIPATGHHHVATVTPPTCTQDGYSTYVCPDCQDTYVSDHTDRLYTSGHSFQNGVCTECGVADNPEETGKCGNTLYWSFYESGKLVIYGQGAMADYSWYDRPWYDYLSLITTVEIREGVTSIESSAFSGSASLKEAFIPANVISIGTNAFAATVQIFCHENSAALQYAKNNANPYCAAPVGEKLGHAYTSVVTEPTCIVPGYTTHTCAWCEHTYQDAVVEIDHNFVGGICSMCGIEEGYVDSGKCGDTVYWVYYESGTLVIYGQGEMDDLYANNQPWTAHRTNIQKVEVLPGVTRIGSNAFYQHYYITQATLPEGLKAIGEEAFACNNGLTEIHLPESLTALGNGAFYKCYYLTEIEIPDQITTIGYNTFYNCTRLTSVKLPESLKTIGSQAFCYCYALENIQFPESLETIDSFAFNSCRFESLILPESLKTIGSSAFADTKLTEVNIPASVTSIGSWAFGSNVILCCYADSCAVTYAESYKNPLCIAPDGEELGHTYVSVVTEPTCIVPGYTTHTCSRCEHTYQDAVVEIDHNFVDGICAMCGIQNGYIATGKCGNTLYWSLYSNGKLVIYGLGEMYNYGKNSNRPTWNEYVSQITAIEVRSGTTSIGAYAFYNHSAVKTVSLNDGLITLKNHAFDGCAALTGIQIPATVCDIEYGCFRRCYGFTSITIPEGITVLGSATFEYCTSLHTVFLPQSLKTIGYQCFQYCAKLKNITIPQGVTNISDNAFYSCGELKSITLPEGLTSIGQYSFGATGLTSIVIPQSVTSIQSHAFSGCSSMKTAWVPETVTSVGNYAFHTSTLIFCHEGSAVLTYAQGRGNPCCIAPSGEALGHTYVSTVTAPTCTDEGYTTHICSRCTNQSVGVGSYIDSYVDALGHDYGVWYTTAAPDCTETGMEQRDCNRCDHYETNVLDALGHAYIYHPGQEATCTEFGWYDYDTCSRCDYTTYEIIPATGHWVCMKPFSFENTSSVPFLYENGVFRSMNHAHSDASYFIVTVERDITVALRYRVSSETNFDKLIVLQNDTQILNVSGIQGWTSIMLTLSAGDVLSIRYQKDGSVHANQDTVWFAFGTGTMSEDGQLSIPAENLEPTCTESVICSYCQEVLQAALGHDYGVVVTNPNCTEQGYTTHTCSRCEDTYVDSYVDALGHDYTEWYTTAVPNCTETGMEQRDCNRCDHYETHVLDAYGHSYEATVTPPTCTEDGYTTYVCSVCDDTYVDDYVDALGHSYEATVTPPTCTEGGYTTYVCNVCDDAYVDDYVDALGHSYGEWYQTLAPNCIEYGQMRHDCGRCNHFETQDILPLYTDGHSFENGLCTICGLEEGYQEIGKCGDHLFWAFYEDGTLVINGFGAMYDFTEESQPWVAHSDQITTVEIMPGATSIGRYAFNGHRALVTVTTPDTLVTIGERAFESCDALKTVELREGLQTLGYAAFWFCDGIVTIDIPDTVTKIDSFCFAGCNGLESIRLPASMTHLSNYAFYLASVKEVYLPDNLISIGENAFGGCYEISQIMIPETVKTIGKSAFSASTLIFCHEDSAALSYAISNGNAYCAAPSGEMLGHAYESVVTDATCTEQGYTTHTCSRCSDAYVDGYVDAHGHSFTNYVSDGNATAEADGTKTAHCDHGCGETHTVTDEGSRLEPEGLLGDVDGNGDVDAEDLTILARHVAGIEQIEDQTLLASADVDGDGDVDAEDLTKLARYVAGIITDWDQD